MNKEQKDCDEMRSAFVDGQLDAADWARMAEAVERDPGLREETCALLVLKEMVHQAYATPPARPDRLRHAGGWTNWRAIAAAVVVAVTGAAGWFGHAWWENGSFLDPTSAYALRGDWQALRSDWRTLDNNRILVHVSSKANLATALDEVEDLLRAARAEHRRIEVEVVANSTGIELLDAKGTAYAARVAALHREFPELSLVACAQTLVRQHAAGRQFELLPGTEIAPSALDEVVRRLRAGWVYVRA